MFPTRHPNLNAVWSALLLEELWRLGVRDLCIAPGSRSAPLTLEAAEVEKFSKHVHFDERGLGFLALGLAKSTNRPVAVITTSGTAVANLYPALVEARQSGIPLILMTADRPPELIGCGANQAINQLGIFSDYPEATLNLPTPSESISAQWLLGSLDYAFSMSCAQKRPMHINCMFREPLYPTGVLHDFSDYLSVPGSWKEETRVYKEYSNITPCRTTNLTSWFSEKGVIVAGSLEPEVPTRSIINLARFLGWPLIADIQSQLHGHPDTMTHSDLMLATNKGSALLKEATHAIQFGGRLVSKRLGQFLTKHHWHEYWMIGRDSGLQDPGYNQTRQFTGDIKILCQGLRQSFCESNEKQRDERSRWAAKIVDASNEVNRHLERFDEQDADLNERWIGRELIKLLPKSANLFVGNSLPIRCLDMFSSSQAGAIYANRGASGIDGLVATVAGCAKGLKQLVVAIVGDLSFLHDLNSLNIFRTLNTPVVLIVVNNDGGGIFKMLPGKKSESTAKDYFQTPHGLNCKHAAEMFSLGYKSPESQTAFKAALVDSCDVNGCTLIEITTPAGEAAVLIKQVVSQLEAKV